MKREKKDYKELYELMVDKYVRTRRSLNEIQTYVRTISKVITKRNPANFADLKLNFANSYVIDIGRDNLRPLCIKITFVHRHTTLVYTGDKNYSRITLENFDKYKSDIYIQSEEHVRWFDWC